MNWFELMNNPVFELSRRWRELEKIANPYAEYFGTPQMQHLRKLDRFVSNRAFKGFFDDYRAFLEREHLTIKEKKVKPLVKMYKGLIKKDFEVNVQFDDFFFECFGEMPILEFLERTIDDGFVLNRLIKYAKEKRQDFKRMVKEIERGEAKIEPRGFCKFDELFGERKEDLVLIESMLIEWEFLSPNGVLLLNKKEYYKIVAVCDALKHCDIVPKLTDSVLHGLFMVKLGLEYKKLKRSSGSFERDKAQYIRDIDRKRKHLKAPKST